MLIIFDLDDTLIDRAGSLGPMKLKDALNSMIQQGLTVESKEGAHKTMCTIDQTTASGKETIQQFCKQVNQPSFAELGIKEYYENIDPTKVEIPCMPFAKELLEQLNREHQLALVTFGKKDQQLQKIKHAGIDKSAFKRVHITSQRDKDLYYKQLMRSLNFNEEQTVVIGDSIERDLLPAKRLGVQTIHFRSGRGKHVQYTTETTPSFSITSLKEVVGIIDRLK